MSTHVTFFFLFICRLENPPINLVVPGAHWTELSVLTGKRRRNEADFNPNQTEQRRPLASSSAGAERSPAAPSASITQMLRHFSSARKTNAASTDAGKLA